MLVQAGHERLTYNTLMQASQVDYKISQYIRITSFIEQLLLCKLMSHTYCVYGYSVLMSSEPCFVNGILPVEGIERDGHSIMLGNTSIKRIV